MDIPWPLAIPITVGILALARLMVWLWPSPIRKVGKPSLPGMGWQLIYQDAYLLKDPRHKLQGKPDMVYQKGRGLIPVELKSGRIGDRPHPREGDLMQLAVYFLLAEAEWGIRPKTGRLIYSDGMFVVKNSRGLRRQLLRVLRDMGRMLNSPDGYEAEPSFQKCRHCVCRGTVCGEGHGTD